MGYLLRNFAVQCKILDLRLGGLESLGAWMVAPSWLATGPLLESPLSVPELERLPDWLILEGLEFVKLDLIKLVLLCCTSHLSQYCQWADPAEPPRRSLFSLEMCHWLIWGWEWS